ncbi:TackOD1 domain-containing metal-binding protein [Marinobacter orientalis]|uniref:TackOD1 domain-containing metal-binding protein n=1 Tax=Marinobacter orientalis TaxID=1928859 RepID=UPI0019826181|nr:hypothetical protein [Marinobacter orientalis]
MSVWDVVVIDQPYEVATESVFRLRCSSHYRYTLIYCRRSGDAPVVPLSDGPPPDDPEHIWSAWRQWSERMKAFNRGNPPEQFEERVLAWLWARPNALLEPQRDSKFYQFYRYPLLSAMVVDESVNQLVWLKLINEQGWLQPDELIDRIRLCSRCSSGRLNYVDVCPECNALDLVRQPSLHCFTCGHVASQESFLREGLLMCPNCLTRLRHIGSDYDRPLENYRCLSCQCFFVDADVEARCFDCDTRHSPDELKIREVRAFRLTENGRLRCRQGFAAGLQEAHFGRLNLIAMQAFNGLLDWQIQQSRRYGEMPKASLLLLKFSNLGETLDNTHRLALLDNLIDRIQETVRDTDRCSRSREDLLWFLLPNTDRDGMITLWQRLSGLTHLFQENDEFRIEIELAGYTLPDDLLPQEDAQLLMARLTGEVG